MSGEDGGMRDAAGRVAASALRLLRTRLELASVEFALEREQVKTTLALIAVAAVAFALVAMVVTLGIIAWFWDDHRYAAIAIVALVYAVAGIIALAAQRRIRRATPTPFSATIEALRRDAEWLRARRAGARGTEDGPGPEHDRASERGTARRDGGGAGGSL